MELLQLLAQQKNCAYLSDLKAFSKQNLRFPGLRSVDLSAFPEDEWIEAASYLLDCKCVNGNDARDLLIGSR